MEDVGESEHRALIGGGRSSIFRRRLSSRAILGEGFSVAGLRPSSSLLVTVSVGDRRVSARLKPRLGLGQ